jgi:ABC-type nitrate/sulfonate/bicarbonate transport system substrate-binding protein
MYPIVVVQTRAAVRRFACAGLLACALVAHAQPDSAALTEIKVSYQPALYWALPFYVATQKSWWAELGLKPTFSTYPAGVPQITAAATGAWDVGGTGSVPAVLGFVRHGIKTVGITNDESAGNVLVVRKDLAEQALRSPRTLRGQSIALTANSTVDYAVQNCLKRFGLQRSDVTIKPMPQADAIKALASGSAELAGLWAPNVYVAQENLGARTVCSGKEARSVVAGALVARGEYARNNPANVAKFLAIYLRAWQWLNANRAQALALMKAFYEQGGIRISEAAMRQEFDTRPTFDLTEQLAKMDRSDGNSEVDDWFGDMALYMRANGAVKQFPHPTEFITDEYMKLVQADPKLREFANRGN